MGVGEYIAQAIIGSLLGLIVFLAQGVLAIGIALLNGAINFTLSGAVSLTNPAKNEIIRIGWTLIRDFVNIGFILGLVYIGLATALRTAGFELKKVFPWFLIMALLINFTPVISGVVVDAANMVTKFFLGAMANWSLLGEVYSLQITAIGDLFGGISWVPVAKLAFLVAFGFVAGFVLIVFAVLLLLRAIIIPLLVIFSPLAFLAYIFPQTRGLFKKWWGQLLQWSFIGAVGGFFLYLSRLALREQAMFNFAIPTKDPALGTFMEQIAPSFMAVAFLMVGLFVTLSTSATGASMVTGFAKKQGKVALKWGGKGATWLGERATRKGREKLGAAMSMMGKDASELGKWMGMGKRKTKAGKVVAGIGGWALRGIGYGVGIGGAKLEAQATESYERDVKEARAKAKGATLATQHAMLMSPFPSVRTGALQAAIEDKKIKGLRETMSLGNEEITKILRKTLRTSPSLFRDLKDALPELAAKAAAKEKISLNEPLARQAGVFMDVDDIKKFETLAEKIRATVKPSKMENWNDEQMKAALRSTVFHRNMTPGQISQLAKTFEGTFFVEWKKQVRLKSWYKTENAPIRSYIASNAGRGLGIDFAPEGEEPGTPPEKRKAEKETVTGGVGRKPIIDIEKDKQTGIWGMKKRRKKDTGE